LLHQLRQQHQQRFEAMVKRQLRSAALPQAAAVRLLPTPLLQVQVEKLVR
jgi:hypothetical protein